MKSTTQLSNKPKQLRPQLHHVFSISLLMAFIHRKVTIDPLYEVVKQLCKPYCDMITNPDGSCPSNCFSICNSLPWSSSCKTNLPDIILLSAAPPPPQPWQSSTHHIEISTGLVILILSIITVFSLFFCFMLYKCYKVYRSRRRLRTELETGREYTHQEFVDEDHGYVLDHPIWYIRTVGLPPSVISAITICKYKKGEGLVEGTECSVCLNEYEDETLRLMPKCNHAFRIPCIDTWLRSHTNCPLCRAAIVSIPAMLTVPEQRILDNSNVVEDSQIGVLGNAGENRREDEVEDSELRDCLRVQPRSQSERRNGIEKEEFGYLDQLEVNDVVQPIRRSASLDFSYAEIVKGSDVDVGFVKKRVNVNHNFGSSSSARSKEQFSMKRSFSYSGKVLFPRHNNSQSRS